MSALLRERPEFDDQELDIKQTFTTVESSGLSENDVEQEEARALRARGAELEERQAAARASLASARERREFMQEEAEQAREYSSELGQEMSRLARIEKSLTPDQRSAIETLRRLITTLTTLEQSEGSAREEFRTREEALRAEIDEFTSAVTRPTGSALPSTREVGVGRAQVGTRQGSADSKSSSIKEKTDDPLARANNDDENAIENLMRNQQQSAGADDTADAPTARPSLEGKALLAEGLHRIEAAHEVAAAEREAMATRLSKLRLAVARRQREEDATPGHAELLQYLTRFEELGRHARERQNQLRRCQAERSTLALTREVLADESRLLETIASGVDEAAHKQKATREAYMRRLEGMIKGVEDSLLNQIRLLEAARGRRRAAAETQEAVLEEKRRFLRATRDLCEACMKHGGLKAHLSLMRR